MNFFANIKGTEHELVQGFTVSEEYNETLDSASIIITTEGALNLDIFDDVFIYGEWVGVINKTENKMMAIEGKRFVFKGYPLSPKNYLPSEMPCFYKHFLINSFSEEILILGENEGERYKYTIDLFSETKGLETIQVPNVSVTQPLKDKIQTSVLAENFLENYNRKIRRKTIDSWVWDNKYKVASRRKDSASLMEYYIAERIEGVPIEDKRSTFLIIPHGDEFFLERLTLEGKIELSSIFEGSNKFFCRLVSPELSEEDFPNCDFYRMSKSNEVCTSFFGYELVEEVFARSFCPDFSLNNPSLREVLAKLFVSKDRIPIVFDGYIYLYDTTARRCEFDMKTGEINYIVGSLSNDNYCSDLKRNYSEALSQNNTGKSIEYIGFRNSDTPLMSFDNMRLETRFPIYKINKLYMCYYKTFTLKRKKDGATQNFVFLCEQDITPLVKLNSERKLLSSDTEEFSQISIGNTTIDEFAKYKMSTVEYSIGSKDISGWGQVYQYPTKGLASLGLNTKCSYIEVIFNFMDFSFPYGRFSLNYILNRINPNYDLRDYEIVPFLQGGTRPLMYDETFSLVENLSLAYKHLVFKVEYHPFYSGTVFFSKALGKEGITINDNPSSALTLLELDGLAQKEKINRYGNKGLHIPARYQEITDLEPLGAVFNRGLNKDIVIYHKEYSINDKVINCTYYGTKDYVLKNFFTSVYARHRTYNLMSYGESVERADNKRVYVLLSKTKKRQTVMSKEFEDISFPPSFVKQLLSFYQPTVFDEFSEYEDFTDSRLNCGFIVVENERHHKIFISTDFNSFTCGNSLCLNITMSDNVTAGVFIENMDQDIEYLWDVYDHDKLVQGSKQDWAWLVFGEGRENGRIENMSFVFGHYAKGSNFNSSRYIKNLPATFSSKEHLKNFLNSNFEKLYKLPLLKEGIAIENFITNKIEYNFNVHKDNKERVNMTIQFELLNDDEIYISPWTLKLSNLFTGLEKYAFDLNYNYKDPQLSILQEANAFCMFGANLKCRDKNLKFRDDSHYGILAFPRTLFDSIRADSNNFRISGEFNFTNFAGKPLTVAAEDFALTIPHNYARKVSISMSQASALAVTDNSITLNLIFFGEGMDYYDLTIYNGIERNINFVDSITFQSVDRFNYRILESEGTLTDGVATENLSELVFDKMVDMGYAPEEYVILATEFKGYSFISNGETGLPASYPAGKNDIGRGMENLVFSSLRIETFKDKHIFKEQNLLWVVDSNDIFEDYMVHDDIPSESFDSLYPEKIDIEISFENSSLIFTIDEEEKRKHKVLCYYKDGEYYRFVFGFKPEENNSITAIKISLLSSKDMDVYDESNCKVGVVLNDIPSSGTGDSSDDPSEGSAIQKVPNINNTDTVPGIQDTPSNPSPTIMKITILALPRIQQYYEGELPNYDGLRVEVCYANGLTKELNKIEYTLIEPLDVSEPGTKTIQIRYEAASAYFNMWCLSKELTALEIVQTPYNTDYFQWREPNFEGLIVEAIYGEDERKTLNSNEYEIEYPDNENIVGTHIFAVKFLDKKAEFTMNCIKNIVINLVITSFPMKLEYFSNSTPDFEGLAVRAYFLDNTTRLLNFEEFDIVFPEDYATPGLHTFEVTADEGYDSFDLTCILVEVTALNIVREPNKTVYYMGEQIVLTGLTVALSLSDGSTEVINRGKYTTIKPERMLLEGVEAADFEYVVVYNNNEEFKDSFYLTFKEKLVDIETIFPTNGTRVQKDSEYDLNEMEVYAVWRIGSLETDLERRRIYWTGNENGYSSPGLDTSTRGNTILAITYKDLTKEIEFYIFDPSVLLKLDTDFSFSASQTVFPTGVDYRDLAQFQLYGIFEDKEIGGRRKPIEGGNVQWTPVDYNTPGIYDVEGTYENLPSPVTLKIVYINQNEYDVFESYYLRIDDFVAEDKQFVGMNENGNYEDFYNLSFDDRFENGTYWGIVYTIQLEPTINLVRPVLRSFYKTNIHTEENSYLIQPNSEEREILPLGIGFNVNELEEFKLGISKARYEHVNNYYGPNSSYPWNYLFIMRARRGKFSGLVDKMQYRTISSNGELVEKTFYSSDQYGDAQWKRMLVALPDITGESLICKVELHVLTNDSTELNDTTFDSEIVVNEKNQIIELAGVSAVKVIYSSEYDGHRFFELFCERQD